LAFGLLPGILLHFIYDTVSFAIPLFAADTPGIWVERGMVALCALIPLWIVLASRMKTKQWLWLPQSELNGAWKPDVSLPKKLHATEFETEESGTALGNTGIKSIRPFHEKAILLLTLSAVVTWLFFFNFENQSIRLDVSREQAIGIARKTLDQFGFPLSPSWKAGSFIVGTPGEEEDFIWKTGGVANYRKLLGSYLAPSGWLVRFFRLDSDNSDVAERAEEFQVFIYNSGEVYRIRHEVPEGRALPSLSEEAARKVALNTLQKTYGIDQSHLKELSSTALKLPARTDWHFVFANPTVVLPSGEARISVKVVGDSVASIQRFVFIPEAWARSERNRQNSLGILKGISALIVALLLLAGVGISLKRWVQHTTSYKSFWLSFGVFSLINLVNFLNGLPVRLAQFSTEGPRLNQFVALFSLGFIKILFMSGSLALLFSHLSQVLKRYPQVQTLTGIRIGYSLGILGAFLLAGVSHVLPPLGPVAGKLDALNGFIPFLYSFQTLLNYIAVTSFFLLIGNALQTFTQAWRKNQIWAALILLFLGFILSGLQAEDWSRWLIMGLCTGLVLLLGYRFMLKSTLNLLPLATAGIFILAGLKELNLNAYVGSTWVLGISLLVIVAVSGLFV
ncbi:MAG: hypothetical protein ABI041_11835, partial [Bdellovibrionia bacterium]